MKHTLSQWALALLAAAVSPYAVAQRVEISATGSYALPAAPATKKSAAPALAKPTEEEKNQALEAAKASAWKKYVAGMTPARQQAVFKNEQALVQRLDEFVTDVVVVDAVKDVEGRSVKVAARFGFNDERVGQAVQSLSVGEAAAPGGGAGSTFSFLFVARKASSITQFDARKSTISQTENAGVKSADRGESSTSIVTQGGSTLQKEDAITYEVSSSQDLDAAIGENLSASGIEYVGYEDIVANCNALAPAKFRDEFVRSDEMSPETRKQVIGAAKSCEVRYFAFGTVDAGVASVDPVSGNKRVYASVRAQLWDISQRLPKKVGSVGPKQYAGLGPDQTVASRNALNSASRDVARALVDQLNAKGIR